MINKLFTMEGNVCVVTGGSRGLGFYMAQGFLEAGAARVYITARKAAACIQAAEELSQFGECIALPGDISSLAGIDELTAALGERESSIDVLVNNAGAGWGAPLEEFPEKGWDKVMDINVKAPFFLTQALLPMPSVLLVPEKNPIRNLSLWLANLPSLISSVPCHTASPTWIT